MGQFPPAALCLCATLRKASFLAVAACALVAAGPLTAADFPQTVSYQGEALDAAGMPLAGNHAMTFRYFGPGGKELLAESMGSVAVAAGRFAVQLGTGVLAEGGAYPSLEALFAANPQVELEVAVDGVVYEPRLGILPAGHSLKSRLVLAGVRKEDDGQAHWEGYAARGGATAVQSGILAPAGSRRQPPVAEGRVWRRPYTLPVVGPMLSRPVRDLPPARHRPLDNDAVEINQPRHESLYDGKGRRFGTTAPKVDDYLAGPSQSGFHTPSLITDFEGLNNISGVLPPDTEGAVGPNHYVQVVNLVFAIYNKSGTLLAGPANTNTLWSGFGGPCQTDNSGDAIFLYDQQANRWVLTQFAVSGSHQSVCWAVSQTSDPTGSYYLYEVVTPRFPDYYKVGAWAAANNNAYFFGTNSGFQGQYDVFAVDRARMLTGSTARSMQFFQNFPNLMMPADEIGPVGPAADSPGIFYSFRDGGEPYFGSPPTDSLDVYEFDVDWTTPSNSTLTLATSITPSQGLAPFNWTVCGFFVSNCIPQPGTSQGIDSASWWPMQRLVYRNFGSYEALVGAWTVDVNSTGNRAAPRWFELRNVGSGWTLFQQGTQSPDAIHRWMPSVAMDGSGNIAVGYSRGDGSNYASIYYATRLSTDPLDTLETEALMWAGSGSQTHSAARWGDYSSMTLDPADDCTFWYTNEYLATTGSAPWRTHIGAFRIPGCGGPINNPPAVTITAPADGSSFDVGTSIAFAGTANDVEDGNLSSGLSWTSSIDGPIGSGASFNTSSLSLGSHLITAQVTDSGGAPGSDSITVNVTDPNSNGPQTAVYNGSLGAPACAIAGSSCDSVSLLNGRDGLGPEPNQPNTLDGCSDGTSGTYHSDESNDRIVVSTVSGSDFTEGAAVHVEATVWAWSTGSSDTLDLYYAANANSPSWVYLTSIVPPAGGVQTVSANYTLPTGTLQAVRATFRYVGSASPCTTGAYDDHDDLVFAVKAAGGNTAPAVTITAPPDGSSYTVGTSVGFAGTANDAEDGDISSSLAWTSSLDGAIGSGASFSTSSLSVGTHTITASVTDSGGLPGSDSITVTINPVGNTPPSVTITAPPDPSTFNQGDSVSFAGTATDAEDGNLSANLAWTSNLDGAIGSGASFSTSTLSVGTHTITASVTDSGGAPGSDTVTVTINPVGGGSVLWMSFKSNTTVPGVGTVANEDVVSYDEGTGQWALQFDGSDVGLASLVIDGLAVLPNGHLLLSFTAAATVGGMSVDDSDIVEFTPTSLGANTAGSFSFYFDGSDVGLTSNGEDVDAIALAADGRLIVSTTGNFSGTGASGADEDLFIFTGTLGSNTSGSFAQYFDGSDVALTNSSEDIDAATLTAAGQLLFSTNGNFAVSGASGSGEDVGQFTGTFGTTTSGTFTLRHDLSVLGISSTANVGSMHIID
jgi:hypothetical protein